MRFDDKGFARVTEAIGRAERNTAGQIVVVVADRAAGYGGWRAGFAVVALMALSLGVWLFVPTLPPGWLLAAQPLVYLALLAIAALPPVTRRLVPTERMDFEVDRAAKAAFVERGVHRTSSRAGVLLYVSMTERRVSILGDEAVHRVIGTEGWNAQLRGLAADLHQGRGADGLVRAVVSVGEVLARHFPPGARVENELPNEVVRRPA